MIVGRGGGSQEDLWAFNSESVARAVAACRVPIVSAVGHEVDVTITDLAADVRASTPSNAAEIVVPDGRALGHELDALERRLVRALETRLGRGRLALERLSREIGDPRHAAAGARKRLELLGARLERAMARAAASRRRELGVRRPARTARIRARASPATGAPTPTSRNGSRAQSGTRCARAESASCGERRASMPCRRSPCSLAATRSRSTPRRVEPSFERVT